MLNENIQAQVHITTSRRAADIRAAAVIAERLAAQITIDQGGTSRAGPSARGKARRWISHHNSKGGVAEILKQVAANGPKQTKRLAKRTIVRRRSTSTANTPNIDSVDPPRSVRCHVLVGVSASELSATQASDEPTQTIRTIELTIGPRFWWGEPWQPALAHRNLQLLRVGALVSDHGQIKGHVLRCLTVAADDSNHTIAARFSEVAADICADLMISDFPLLPGQPTDDSPLSERIVADDTATFDSATWTDLIRSITRF